jgi:hypothetical protein
MKRYKVSDYNIHIYNFSELSKTDYLSESINLLKKKYGNISFSKNNNIFTDYVIILKNKKVVGFLCGNYDIDFHIVKFKLNINLKKDLIKIFKKLLKIYNKLIMLSIYIDDSKIINALKESGFDEWKSMKVRKHKNKKWIYLYSWKEPLVDI